MAAEDCIIEERKGGWRRLLLPTLPDLFFVALLLALFGRPLGLEALISDGDTGWHIRTGEYILRTGTVPTYDLFSFTKAHQPWFAWEWLSDVWMARLYGWRGLAGVVLAAAVLVCAWAGLLFAWLLRRGAGLWVSAGVALAAVSASSIHFLARPHLFSLLFLTLGLWLLDEDRRRRTPAVWLGIPLSALWANLHGGFVIWLAILALLVTVSACLRSASQVRRYSILALASAFATLLNPYGWTLHFHILQYLRSSWIMEHVTEFQSPQIRSENMLVFAALLLGGVALATRAWGRRQHFEAVLVWVLGFAALRSARHIPLFAVAAAPLIAGELSIWWEVEAMHRRRGHVLRVLFDLGSELGRSRGTGGWLPILGAAVLVWAIPPGPLNDFPGSHFPVAAVAQNRDRLAPAGAMPRILTSDQWSDYLLFRLYPRQRVFFDGRSDFYGPDLGDDYRVLLNASPQWRATADRYRFDLALLPREWPLARVLETDPGWERIYSDSVALLYQRRIAVLKQLPGTADCEVARTANELDRLDGDRGRMPGRGF